MRISLKFPDLKRYLPQLPSLTRYNKIKWTHFVTNAFRFMAFPVLFLVFTRAIVNIEAQAALFLTRCITDDAGVHVCPRSKQATKPRATQSSTQNKWGFLVSCQTLLTAQLYIRAIELSPTFRILLFSSSGLTFWHKRPFKYSSPPEKRYSSTDEVLVFFEFLVKSIMPIIIKNIPNMFVNRIIMKQKSSLNVETWKSIYNKNALT